MHDDIAGEPSGLCGGPEALTSLGDIICALRSNLGWSQGRLAEELGKVSGHPSITREYVSRWEHGRKIPGPFWIGHLAAVFQVPRWVMEGHVRRRDMLRLTGVAAIGAVAGVPAGSPDSKELFASIAAGDPQPLAQIQTSHATDLALSRQLPRTGPSCGGSCDGPTMATVTSCVSTRPVCWPRPVGSTPPGSQPRCRLAYKGRGRPSTED